MTTHWKFYLPEAHPTGLDEQVGGAISSTELKPYLGELFTDLGTDALIAKTQYRKVFAKQVSAETFDTVLVELGNVEHTGQISFYAGDFTGFATNAVTLPNVLQSDFFSGNSTTHMTGLTTSVEGSTIPIWIKESLPAGVADDGKASFTLRIRATKT